jgi:hypothetical protein
MTKQERVAATFGLELPDRPPILGGWLAAPDHIQALTGCSADEYWADPFHWGLEAERVLGSDGVITVFQPIARGAYRCVDHHTLEARAAYTVEAVLDAINAMPEPDQLEAEFDFEQAYAEFAQDLVEKQALCGDIVWCPADWGMIPKALWYHEFGYEGALTTLALHPDVYRKLIQVSATRGRQRAVLHARAMREGIHSGAILTGEDICSQQGPMVSPKYLRREYFALVEHAIEPVLEAGIRVVWHCDGDYRPLLTDVLACGISGLQGFQPECGMELEWIVDLRTRDGDPLLIYGPMPVTKTLRFGTPQEVREVVDLSIDLCRDRASLAFFTSNTINPDVPLDNILAYWQAVTASSW